MGSTVTTGEDADRPERTAILGSAKPWADLPVKMHNIQRGQRGQSNEQDHEKNPGAGYGDYDLISDLPQHSDLESQRATERATEREGFHKPWYGSGTNAPDATIGRRNGFDTHAYENHRAPRPTQAVNQLHSKQNITNRSSRGMSRNWKNSEEEEYMWDDMNSRLRDRAETDNSRKDGWNRNDSEKPPSLQSSKWMPLGTDLLDSQWKTGDSFFRLEKSSRGGDRVSLQREIEDGEQPHDEQVLRSKINRETSTDSQSSGLGGQAVFGHTVKTSNHTSIAPTIAGQLEDHPTFLSGSLSKSMNMSLVRTGLQSHMEPSVSGAMHSGIGSLANTVSGSVGMFGHQQQHPPRPASPTALSSLHQRSHSPSPGPPHQHEKSYNLTDPDNPQSHSFPQSGQKPLQIAGLPNRALHPQVIQDSLPIVPQSQIQPVMVSQSPQQHLQSSLSSLMPFTQQRPHLPFSLLPQPEISQSSSQTKKPLLQPSILGTHQMVGPSDSSQSNNPVADLSVQSSTGSILATITKSGLVSNNSVTNSFPNTSYPELMMPSHSTIQPPLPSGPPPIQLAASSSLPPVTPTSVLGPTLTTHSLRALMPPLPPGPPPASSVVVTTSSQMSIPATAAQNPLSSLLSSLVAKGLISAPTKESPTENTSQIILTQVQNQTVVGLPTTSLQVSSTSPSFSIPSSTANELPFSESRKGTTALSQASIQKRKDLIGTEFRQDIIRELHPEAISGLFDDLPHQCGICGCRFELQEQFSKHLDWHASKKHELCSSIRVSRKWYLGFSEWVAGNTGLSIGPVDTPSVKGVVVVTEKCQLMVPADENQCICALCGEPFEDFYSDERDEWMYKGAVYMEELAGEGDKGSTDGNGAHGPIVHAICMSKSPTEDLEEA